MQQDVAPVKRAFIIFIEPFTHLLKYYLIGHFNLKRLVGIFPFSRLLALLLPLTHAHESGVCQVLTGGGLVSLYFERN